MIERDGTVKNIFWVLLLMLLRQGTHVGDGTHTHKNKNRNEREREREREWKRACKNAVALERSVSRG